MKRLIATGSCKTDDHVRALLKYLELDQREADSVLGFASYKLEFEGGHVDFLENEKGHRAFEITAFTDAAAMQVHAALTLSTVTHTFHWRCRFIVSP